MVPDPKAGSPVIASFVYPTCRSAPSRVASSTGAMLESGRSPISIGRMVSDAGEERMSPSASRRVTDAARRLPTITPTSKRDFT
ncbi:hypothetical protein Csp2054_06260 [Curtobacterium sp. 'Ferrero']|nr:hypothetical protein Csp2054_06260 [Curtobacterium sp. 'Ferrero']